MLIVVLPTSEVADNFIIAVRKLSVNFSQRVSLKVKFTRRDVALAAAYPCIANIGVDAGAQSNMRAELNARESSAPVNVEYRPTNWGSGIVDFMNDSARFGSGRFMDTRFLKELRAFENRLIQLRAELEKRLDAGAGTIE